MALKVRDNIKSLTGAERLAIIFLCLGEDKAAEFLERMDESEITAVSHSIAGLGTIASSVVEQVMFEFAENMGQGANLIGNYDTAEKMLLRIMPERRVAEIMGEIRGPLQGRNMWDRFSNLNESLIANYLKNENPQTVAAIMSKIKGDTGAKVLALLPKAMQMDVVQRMINMDAVPRDVLVEIESTLMNEFMATATRASASDPHERMAEIFNRLDPDSLQPLMEGLEREMPDALQRIKQKMFTFEDLVRLDANSLAKVMRGAEGKTLPMALKGASDSMRKVFLDAMPERSRNILLEEIQIMGAVRLKECQEAQSQLVAVAKQLAEEGAIVLPQGDEDDAMIV